MGSSPSCIGQANDVLHLYPFGERGNVGNMNTSDRQHLRALDADASVRIHAGGLCGWTQGRRPFRLKLLEGRVWLTCEGSPADTVIDAPSTVTLSGHGHMVLQALSDAVVSIEAA